MLAKEDMRSRFAAEYAAALVLSFRSAKLAKDMAAELMRRREDAIQKVEKQLAMQRAERTAERRSQERSSSGSMAV